MQNQTVILILTILMNTANALVGFAAFKQGSVGFIVCAVIGAAISNTLALFGRPAMASAVTEATKTISGASLRAMLPLAFIALTMSGCATTNKIIADEVAKCGPGVLSAYAQSKNVLMMATSKEAALGELMAIAQAVGADASAVYCVVSVIVNDLKAARSQDGGSAAASAQLRPLVAGGDAMYPADPVAHGIALGQDILATKGK